MAISSKLSSEIATALFAEKERSPEEMNTLKGILFEVHSTLQSLTDAERREREAASARAGRPLIIPKLIPARKNHLQTKLIGTKV